MKTKILLIEDDDEEADRIYSLLSKALRADIQKVRSFADLSRNIEPVIRLFRPDVILLDVMGIGAIPEEVIRYLREADCHVPVIVVSNSTDASSILDYLNAGAVSVIPKTILFNQGSAVSGYEAMVKEANWEMKNALKALTTAIQDGVRIKGIQARAQVIGVVRKQAKGKDDSDALEEQWDILRYLNGHQILSSAFPKALRQWGSGSNAFGYEMECFSAKTVRQEILSYQQEEQIQYIEEPLFKFLIEMVFNNLFQIKERKRSASEGFEHFYINKVTQRLKVAKDAADKTPAGKNLKPLLSASWIHWGLETIKNPVEQLRSLSQKKATQLLPERVGLLHGDLHLHNILVGIRHPIDPFFRLIDPKGQNFIGDAAYDAGRILMSCYGADLIAAGRYNASNSLLNLKQHGSEVTLAPLEIMDDASNDEPGFSRDDVVSFRRTFARQHESWYQGLGDRFASRIGEHFADSDPLIAQRALLHAACHLLTSVGSVGDISMRTAFYLEGAKLMKRALGEINC